MANEEKNVASARKEHDDMRPRWEKIRAIAAGETEVKEYDNTVRTSGGRLLIPFSPTMESDRYQFYKSEAQFLGFTGDFIKSSIGAMLRKEPDIELTEEAPDDAVDWIRNQFTGDDKPLIAFLDEAILDHTLTGNTWVWVDYDENLERPIPVLLSGESVINWRIGEHPTAGKGQLVMLVVKTSEAKRGTNEFHDDYIDVVRVHDINEKGQYRLRRFEQNESGKWEETFSIIPTMASAVGVRSTEEEDSIPFIPVFPLSGSAGMSSPYIQEFADAEVGHYNANSRRNHLLYGSSSYTPVVTGDLDEVARKLITDAGIGGLWFLPAGATADTLSTPTSQLKDLEAAIAAAKDNMAKLGSRALAPEASSRESGVSLDIRNSTASASLAAYSRRLAASMRQVVTFMVNWRYRVKIDENDVQFTLSTNFTRTSAGDTAVKFALELFKAKIIPAAELIRVCKDNDFLPADLDEEGLDAAVTAETTRRRAAGLEIDPTAVQDDGDGDGGSNDDD